MTTDCIGRGGDADIKRARDAATMLAGFAAICQSYELRL